MSADDTDALLAKIAEGDHSAVNTLLARHAGRLRAMVALRIDTRLAPRLDPSDIVQEALTEAHRKLPAYLDQRPVPFYPWLRKIAWEKLVHMHRQHVYAQRRSVRREAGRLDLSGDSEMLLVDRLAASSTSPSEGMARQESLASVAAALGELSPQDHEIIALKHLENMTFVEVAAVLELTEEAVRSSIVAPLNASIRSSAESEIHIARPSRPVKHLYSPAVFGRLGTMQPGRFGREFRDAQSRLLGITIMPQATASRTNAGEPSIAGFDNLVAEAVALLEAGQPLDIAALTATCPEWREPLEKLLPTLAAMVDLGHAVAGLSSPLPLGEGLGVRAKGPLEGVRPSSSAGGSPPAPLRRAPKRSFGLPPSPLWGGVGGGG